MLADVRRLGGGVRERDRPVEGDAGVGVAAKLQQQPALHPEEVEVLRKR